MGWRQTLWIVFKQKDLKGYYSFLGNVLDAGYCKQQDKICHLKKPIIQEMPRTSPLAYPAASTACQHPPTNSCFLKACQVFPRHDHYYEQMVEKDTSEVYARFFIQMSFGNSLVVQWLGLDTFTAVVQVQSLVWELRAHRSCSVAKQNKTKLKEKNKKQRRFRSYK